jgi:hypothetical protein
MDKMEYTYVNEQLISTSLICPICLDVLKDPHTHIVCDSAFCRTCLLQLTDPICPICRYIWDDILPIEYNDHLPKTNRLIRNMLDELSVKCVQCNAIRRRGQVEHECQSIETPIPIKTKDRECFPIILTSLLTLLFIYSYRNILFERAVNRQTELINGLGIDIDQFLFNMISYLIVKIIEYSQTIFILNIILWFSILFYGDRFTSKTINRILKKFIEI